MSDPNIGRKVFNRYELIEPIGQGSMGKVYLAGDSLLGGVPVAVKFLSQTLLTENMRTRFFREAMTCAQLGQKSMHVVRVSDYGVNEEDIPFYVMEYLKGESVGRLVRKKPLPVPRFLDLTKQILLGLRTAHNGILVEGEVVPIIHRDIKPSNILVTSDPSMGELVKILDFGIAKLMQAGSEQTSTFMGTLAYASPEQMEGRELDGRSDIYSLGVMMYQMLSGTLPVKPKKNTFGSWYKVHRLATPQPLFEFDQLQAHGALNDIVMACLSKQREDRPASIDQIIESISAIKAQVGTQENVESSYQVSQPESSPCTELSSLSRSSLGIGTQQGQKSSSGSSGARDNAEEKDSRRKSTQHKSTQRKSTQRRSLTEDESLIRDLEALLDDGNDGDDGSAKKSKVSSEVPADSASPESIPQPPTEETIYLQQKWPPEMPIAQIVFPRLVMPTAAVSMPTGTSQLSSECEQPPPEGPMPALWAMMAESEIKRRIRDVRYNNFLCTMSPHPMVLWLTAFYSKVEGPRWLPCYLDLKEGISQNILWRLSETQHYRILFFTKEAPNHCVHLRKLTVATNQLKLFKEWAISAKSHRTVGSPQASKAMLKQELENNLKPKILMDFAAMHSDTQSGVEPSLIV